MSLTLLKLGPEFENILEHELSGSVVPMFEVVFIQLLRHSSTTTWVLQYDYIGYVCDDFSVLSTTISQ